MGKRQLHMILIISCIAHKKVIQSTVGPWFEGRKKYDLALHLCGITIKRKMHLTFNIDAKKQRIVKREIIICIIFLFFFCLFVFLNNCFTRKLLLFTNNETFMSNFANEKNMFRLSYSLKKRAKELIFQCILTFCSNHKYRTKCTFCALYLHFS